MNFIWVIRKPIKARDAYIEDSCVINWLPFAVVFLLSLIFVKKHAQKSNVHNENHYLLFSFHFILLQYWIIS